MSRVRIRLRRSAREDLVDLVQWYELQRPGVGSRLRRSFVDSLDSLIVFPQMYPVARDGRRCFKLAHFPILVYYVVEDDIVTVVAVLHASRKRD